MGRRARWATRCGDERGKPKHCARIRTMSDGAETSDDAMLKGLAAAVLFGVSRRGRGRKARRGIQPGDVRSSLRRAAADEGAWGWPVFRRERAKIYFVISLGKGRIFAKFSRKFRNFVDISKFRWKLNSHFRRNFDEISKFRNFRVILLRFRRNFDEIFVVL